MNRFVACFLVSFACCSSALEAQVDVEILFRVDMSVQEEIGNFFPGDFVVVRGTPNSWGCSESLVESKTEPGIYELEIPVFAHPLGNGEYKFNINCGKGDLGRWEDSVGNRRYFVNGSEPDADGDGLKEVVLDPVFFDDALGGDDAEIRFSVDMNVAIASGRMDPVKDILVARDGFNGWGCSESFTDDDDDGIYEFEARVEGLQVGEAQYKFNVSCNAQGWEDAIANRTFEFTGNEPDEDGDGYLDVNLPTVYFDDAEPGPDVEFLFRVDMTPAENLGQFAEGDDVQVVGSFNGWTCDEDISMVRGDDGIYTIEIQASGLPIGPGEYNFDVNCLGLYEPLVGRRNYLIAADLPDEDGDGFLEITPEIAGYDVLDPSPDVEVSFTVDMNAQIAEGFFDPETQEVVVRGMFNGWDCTEPLDEIEDGIYGAWVPIQAHALGTTEYKFNIGCTDVGWENNINNRTYFVTGSEEDADGNGFLDLELEPVYFDNLEPSQGVGPFVRGDCAQGGTVNITSGIFLLSFLFTGGQAPSCPAACDTDGDGALNVTTAIYTFNWLFLGGPPPPEPTVCANSDREEDIGLGCEEPVACN